MEYRPIVRSEVPKSVLSTISAVAQQGDAPSDGPPASTETTVVKSSHAQQPQADSHNVSHKAAPTTVLATPTMLAVDKLFHKQKPTDIPLVLLNPNDQSRPLDAIVAIPSSSSVAMAFVSPITASTAMISEPIPIVIPPPSETTAASILSAATTAAEASSVAAAAVDVSPIKTADCGPFAPSAVVTAHAFEAAAASTNSALIPLYPQPNIAQDEVPIETGSPPLVDTTSLSSQLIQKKPPLPLLQPFSRAELDELLLNVEDSPIPSFRRSLPNMRKLIQHQSQATFPSHGISTQGANTPSETVTQTSSEEFSSLGANKDASEKASPCQSVGMKRLLLSQDWSSVDFKNFCPYPRYTLLKQKQVEHDSTLEGAIRWFFEAEDTTPYRGRGKKKMNFSEYNRILRLRPVTSSAVPSKVPTTPIIQEASTSTSKVSSSGIVLATSPELSPSRSLTVAHPSTAPATNFVDVTPLAVLSPEAEDSFSDIESDDQLSYDDALEIHSSYFQPIAQTRGRGKNKAIGLSDRVLRPRKKK